MLLNRQNGDFTMPPLHLSRHTTLADLQQQFPQIAPQDMGTGWFWFAPPMVSYGGQQFLFRLLFHGERLAAICFGMVARAMPWGEWSEAHELESLRRYHRFLTEQVGEPEALSWGDFGAEYDPKGAVCEMFVRYR